MSNKMFNLTSMVFNIFKIIILNYKQVELSVHQNITYLLFNDFLCRIRYPTIDAYHFNKSLILL